jgi:hypothetical protein
MPHHSTAPRNAALAVALVVLGVGAWGALRTGGRTGAAAARQQLERRRDTVFAEIIRLDQQRNAGKLDEQEHLERRGDLVGELERIYGELDTEAQGPRGDQGMAA